jgi:hypothetical protein
VQREEISILHSPDAFFDVVLEDLSEVVLRARAGLHHLEDTLRLEEDLVVVGYGVLEGLVGHDLRVALDEGLEAALDRLELLLGDLDLAPRHVRRLLGVELVRDAPAHKHVQLDAPLAVLLGLLLRLLKNAQQIFYFGSKKVKKSISTKIVLFFLLFTRTILNCAVS